MTAIVGAGSETQFKFRSVLQEEKPLRDWLQEVLMNCLGYYTFSFGKLKIGVRVNSSTVEAFTIGNIVFDSLQLAPLKPSFDHLTTNFADQDYKFVNNAVTVYDIDRATLLGGAAGPLFLKSNVNLSGTCTKSQAARRFSEFPGCPRAAFADATSAVAGGARSSERAEVDRVGRSGRVASPSTGSLPARTRFSPPPTYSSPSQQRYYSRS